MVVLAEHPVYFEPPENQDKLKDPNIQFESLPTE